MIRSVYVWKLLPFFCCALIVALVYVLVAFNVPVLRQTVGFLYLFVLPGLTLMPLVRPRKSNISKTLLFSVGLSLTVLMFAGLFANEIYPLFGIEAPLSTWPMFVTLSVIVLGASLTSSVLIPDGDQERQETSLDEAGSTSFSPLTLLWISPLVLAAMGSLYYRATGDDTILLFLIVLIGGLVVLGILSADMISSYPLGVVAISLSLLLFTSLSTVQLFGQDVHGEYYVFKLADNALRWSPSLVTAQPAILNFNSMLSITVLPTIVCSVLNLDGLIIFKLVYPIIISLIPLGLFEIYSNVQGDRKVAFLSAFFFVAQTEYFVDMVGILRQAIAEFFLVLIVLLLLDDELGPAQEGSPNVDL